MIASEMSNFIELVTLISLSLSIEAWATAKRGHLGLKSDLMLRTDLGEKAAVCKIVIEMSQKLIMWHIATAVCKEADDSRKVWDT